jgi:hypothetical protein
MARLHIPECKGQAACKHPRPWRDLKRQTATYSPGQTTKRKAKRHMTSFDSTKLQNSNRSPHFPSNYSWLKKHGYCWPSWGQKSLSSLPIILPSKKSMELCVTFSSHPASVMHAQSAMANRDFTRFLGPGLRAALVAFDQPIPKS